MAQTHVDALSNIRQYVAKARELEEGQMELDASETATRLDSTVKELRARVEEQQAALERLRASTQVDVRTAAYASTDPREKLKQLRAVKEAYLRLKPSAPYLPSEGSVLPALLAARTLQNNIRGTKDAIASTQDQCTQAEAALRHDQVNLRDAEAITAAMQARIDRLRAQHAEHSQKTPAQLAKELIAAKRTQKQHYDQRFQDLSEAFHDFISEILSPMLAAEELGGPVVGDMPDVGDETLAAGFTKKGRAKSAKKTPSDSFRQRKIDQIWGSKGVDDGEQLTEAEAADNEMRKLIESLFATLFGPGGGRAYHELDRDSAASRFLVRAKIAQFHPRDARRIRLIDFGRELDD